MNTSRIPDFANKSKQGMTAWFNQMQLRDLLFHPEDSPYDVIRNATSKRLFNAAECAMLDGIMAEMFGRFGDGVCEAAYPVYMKAYTLSRIH